MAETYKIKDLKVSDFQDPNGNTAVNMALEGVGEPVTIFVKDPTKMHEGDELYGNIVEKTSRAGKPYQRFYKEQKEDSNFQKKDYQAPAKKEYQPRDDCAIQAQWAIGQAVQVFVNGQIEHESIEAQAKDFFAMIDRVKIGKADAEPSDDEMNDAIKNGTNTDLGEIPF